MRRNVYHYTALAQPHADLAATFAGDPVRWLPLPAEAAAEGFRVVLRAEGALPSGLARRDVVAQLGPATATELGVARSLTWRALSADALFPVWDGDLQLDALPGGCHLSLMGGYTVPLSVAGDAADRLLGYRVAEACVRRFLLDVGDRLGTLVR